MKERLKPKTQTEPRTQRAKIPKCADSRTQHHTAHRRRHMQSGKVRGSETLKHREHRHGDTQALNHRTFQDMKMHRSGSRSALEHEDSWQPDPEGSGP